ncbi:alpha/beta fold hydrolase [Nonomuraea sp. NPDC026600]|uniref:alpha/beta fold hydrolase n=1 Tax=Nonomuraea sp. NPDC026600 TaxID=3155363 RepID=UPI0033F95C4D
MDEQTRRQAPGAFADLRHGTTHYVLDGPEDGPLVVLVPGATLSLWIWDGLFQRLVESGHRVLGYDLYGRGYSDRPRVRYTHDLFDDQLVDLLEALDLRQPVNLVALAFGGPIASQFALRHPGAVSSLTLVAPDGFGVALTRGQRLMATPVIGTYIFSVVGSRVLERRLADYSQDKGLVERLRVKYVPDLAFKGFKRALTSSIRNIPIHDSRDVYRQVQDLGLPVQVLWGREDRVTPLYEADVRSVFHRADVTLLDNVGHLPHHERLDLTTDLVMSAVRRGREVPVTGPTERPR